MTASPVFGKVYMASQLTDAFARKFYYLRLSITDVCNFRCTYCLPNGYKPGAVNNNGFLSVDEVRRVTRAFSALGTEKVRLTGGEPSLRRDFTEIIAAVRENPAIRHHLSGMVLRDALLRRGWIHQIRQRSDGPAQVFCHPDYAGEIGLIMPYEKDFCATCNRLRVSSVGKLHLCLFGEGGVDLRDLMAEDQQQAALEARIAEALTHKKQTHFLHQGNTGITQNLSYIGG